MGRPTAPEVSRSAAPIAAATACLVALLATGCGQQELKLTDPRTQTHVVQQARPDPCDLNAASPSSFASQVAAAVPGQTICLAAGNYGNWTGTDKAITIRPQAGASPTMSFDFGSGAANFTIDGGHTNLDSRTPGINIVGPSYFDPGSKNITLENTAATGHNVFFVVDIRTDGPGIVVKGNVFHDMEYPDRSAGAVRILPPGDVPASNLKVEYNLFRDMGADGVDGGPAMIIGNEFSNVASFGTADPRHTDVIQIGGVGPDVIKGNFVHTGCSQGIDAFDGTASNTIEDNVIVGCTVHSLVMAGDKPTSTVNHNTVVGDPNSSLLECGSKPGEGSSVTSVRDNILQEGVNSSGVPCQPSLNTHNMFYPGVSTTDFNGTANSKGVPQFVGGSRPTSYAGYALAAGSPGKGTASDGSDVGGRVNLYPRP
jgi:hypothetical protein